MFDIIIVLYIVVSAFLGFRYGLFRRVIHLAAFYVGLLLAQYLSPGFSVQFGYSTGDHPADAHFGVYILIVVLLVVVIEILGALFGDALSFMNALVFDRFFGLLAGIGIATVELAALLYLFSNLVITPVPSGTGHPAVVTNIAQQLDEAYLTRLLRAVRPAATFIFLPVLPGEPARYFAKTYT
jgi:uncharacterized membrane protein required for colicin V production